MKIVVLNNSFLNESHKKRLEALGELTFYEATSSTAEAIGRARGADVVIGDGFLVDFNKEFFESTEGLKILALNSITYSMVDLKVASDKGVLVTNTPGYCARSVAELGMGLVLDVVRKISFGVRKFKENPWEPDPASKDDGIYIGYDLEGRTMGIIGLGNIGKEVAKLSQGFGMKTIAWDRSPKNVSGVEMVTLKELVQRSDVVVVALTYNEETKHTLSADLIKDLKKSAVVVNVAKKDLVDTEALVEVLKSNKIRGAAFDMSHVKKGDELLELDNVVLTPHIGSYTEEAFYKNLPDVIVSNIESFAKGNPVNTVS